MPNSIEILENTLLKLIIRQGLDSDRKLILLDSGELGYSTDINRVFVGDGVTTGGSPVGNIYLGESSYVTSFTNAQVGDLAFGTVDNKLYKFKGGLPSNIDNWKVVAVLHSAGNSITIDSTSNVISLSGGGIKTNRILAYDSSFLGLDAQPIKLPQKTTINSVNYTWPTGGLQNNYALTTDLYGNLSWKAPTAPVTYFVATSANRIPVGTIMSYASGANIPAGWLLCNGQSVQGSAYPDLSSAIGNTYGGNTGFLNVPNLNNKILYGTSNPPQGSTVYPLASGLTTSLSATGTLFVIKATTEPIVSSTITVTNALTAFKDGVNITNQQVSTLVGNIRIGLSPVITPQTIDSGSNFTVDTYGRVTSVTEIPTIMAGVESTINSTRIVNPNGGVKFLKKPVKILKLTHDDSDTSSVETVQVYPKVLSNFHVNTDPYYSIPIDAKTVLLDSFIFTDSGSENAIFAGSYGQSLLETTISSKNIGDTEYLINRVISGSSRTPSTTQCMVPLSSNGVDVVSFALRYSVDGLNSDYNSYIRIIGYTT